LDSRTLSLLLNTLYFATAVCAVSVPLGILLAGLLWRTDYPGRNFWRAILTGMLFVPLYLQTAAWQAGFGLQGWCTEVANFPPLIDGWRGAIWIHSMAALPWVVLIVGLGLRRSERELEEAALLDASYKKVFFHVTLKNTLPAIGAAVLWVAVTTAGEMTVTDFFCIRTYAEELYTQIAIGQDPGVPPPSVLLGVVLTVILILGGLKLLNLFIPRERTLSLSESLTFPLGRWRWPIIVIASLFLLLMIGVPIGSLIYKAGVKVAQTATGYERSFSIVKCLTMIVHAPKEYSREFGWSLSIGSLAATASVMLGILLAWWGRTSTPRPLFNLRFAICNPQFAILLFIAVIFSMPGPILGLGIIHLLNQPNLPPLYWLYDHTILAPTLVLILKSLPAAALVMWYAMQSIPREVLESASVAGAGSWTQLCRIALPMRWSAAVVAWLIALALSLGDLAASIQVVPPGISTLSISIFGLLHYGVEDRVAGLCVTLLLILAGLATIALFIVRRMVKSR
jgi:iron(III) transport system permease protein